MKADAQDKEMLASMAPDELRSAMRTLGYRTQSDLAAAIDEAVETARLMAEFAAAPLRGCLKFFDPARSDAERYCSVSE